MQAIQTKYFGPGNVRGSRFRAACDAGTITVPYDHALNAEDNHRAAAAALAKKLGWTSPEYGKLVCGGLPDGTFAHVFVPLVIGEKYRITARTWWPKSGAAMFKAELRHTESGNVILAVAGDGSAWDYAMRDAMNGAMVDGVLIFPPHRSENATRYFREVCKVDYDHREVPRKSDL